MIKIDASSVCSSRLEDETLILNLDSGFYYTLDAVATEMWEMLVKTRDPEQVVPVIAERYGVPTETVAGDLKELLSHLEAEGLVQQLEA